LTFGNISKYANLFWVTRKAGIRKTDIEYEKKDELRQKSGINGGLTNSIHPKQRGATQTGGASGSAIMKLKGIPTVKEDRCHFLSRGAQGCGLTRFSSIKDKTKQVTETIKLDKQRKSPNP